MYVLHNMELKQYQDQKYVLLTQYQDQKYNVHTTLYGTETISGPEI